MGQNIRSVVVDTDQLPAVEDAEEARCLALLDEYEKFVPWYRDPWHGARILLAAAVGLGLSYMFGKHQLFFYGAVALAAAAIAIYSARYISVVWRTRRLMRGTKRVLGPVHLPYNSHASASTPHDTPPTLNNNTPPSSS